MTSINRRVWDAPLRHRRGFYGVMLILYSYGHFCGHPVAAQDPSQAQSYPSPQTYRLSGGVSHSESLEPMDERDQVGKVFKGAGAGGSGPSGSTSRGVGKGSGSPAGKGSGPGKGSGTGGTGKSAGTGPETGKGSGIAQSETGKAPSTGVGKGPKTGRVERPTLPAYQITKPPISSTGPTKPPPVPTFEITDNRYEVPAWLAGTWQRTDATEVSRTELPSGKKLLAVGKQPARTTDIFGSYKDSEGRIWQNFKPSKKYGQTDRGTAMDYHRVSRWGLEIIGRSALVTVQAAHVIVNKKTRKVTSVFQDEEMNRYQLLVDGKLRTDSSVKVFNGNGDPVLQTRSVSNEIRVAPFKETQTR